RAGRDGQWHGPAKAQDGTLGQGRPARGGGLPRVPALAAVQLPLGVRRRLRREAGTEGPRPVALPRRVGFAKGSRLRRGALRISRVQFANAEEIRGAVRASRSTPRVSSALALGTTEAGHA